MTPHKWSKEIKAWADGAEVEWTTVHSPDDWCELFEHSTTPQWHNKKHIFRIKPQLEYLYVYKFDSDIKLWHEKTESPNYIGKIKLEVDDGTNDNS